MDTAICRHPVSTTDVGNVFNNDTTGIFTGVVIVVRTDAGSTYQVMPLGPTLTITRENKAVQVRPAQYIRTVDGAKPQKIVEKYVGFSGPEDLGLLFFSFDEKEDQEHTRMGAPMTSQLRPDMEVEFALQ